MSPQLSVSAALCLWTKSLLHRDEAYRHDDSRCISWIPAWTCPRALHHVCVPTFPGHEAPCTRVPSTIAGSLLLSYCPYCPLKGVCLDCFSLLHSSTEVLPPLQPSQCDLLDVAQIHVCSFENGTSLCNDCFHGQGISCVQWPCQADSQCGVEQIFPALFKPRL